MSKEQDRGRQIRKIELALELDKKGILQDTLNEVEGLADLILEANTERLVDMAISEEKSPEVIEAVEPVQIKVESRGSRFTKKAESVITSAYGAAFLGFAAFGANRLAQGGSVPRAIAEIGTGTVLGGMLISRDKMHENLVENRFKNWSELDRSTYEALCNLHAVGIIGSFGLSLADLAVPPADIASLYEFGVAGSFMGYAIWLGGIRRKKSTS